MTEEVKEIAIKDLMKTIESRYKDIFDAINDTRGGSPSKKEVFIALARARAEFKPIERTKDGHNYKYAPLESVLDAVVPALSKYDLYLHQFTNEKNVLYTRVGHSSGEYIESRAMLNFTPQGNKPVDHQYGTSMTYMRRYQVLAILGLQPQNEDLDGLTEEKNGK